MGKIIGYYVAPFCPITEDHVLMLFDVMDRSAGCHVAFSPTEGLCFFTVENLKAWVKIEAKTFNRLAAKFPVLDEFLQDEGERREIADVIEKCTDYKEFIQYQRGIKQQ